MKRSMIFVALVLLFIAAPAFGQAPTQPPVYEMAEESPGAVPHITAHSGPFEAGNYTLRAAGVPARHVIDKFVEMSYGYSIDWQSVPNQPLSVNIVNQPRAVIMNTIIREVGHRYSVDPDRRVVVIHRENHLPLQQSAAVSPPVAQPQQLYTTAPTTGTNLDVLDIGLMVSNPVAWEQALARSTRYGPYYGPTYGRYGEHQQYAYLPLWMRGCQDGRPPSYLEFEYKGRRNEKHLWLISINGVGPGTVDQGDTWTQKLPVCSDAAVVVTVEKIGLLWQWERQYSLRPWVSTEIPIGEFLANDKPRIRQR